MNSKSEKIKEELLKRGEIFFKLEKLKNACNDWEKAKNLGALKHNTKLLTFVRLMKVGNLLTYILDLIYFSNKRLILVLVGIIFGFNLE